MKKLYIDAIKNNLFVKIMLVFAVIIVCATATLAYFTVDYMSQSVADNELEKQKMSMERVNQQLSGKVGVVQQQVQDIYRDPSFSYSLSYLLKHSFSEYMNFKMDSYYNNLGSGVDDLDFFKKMLENDADIANMLLFSSEKQFLYMFGQSNLTKLYQTPASKSYVPDAMALESSVVATPNPWVRKTIGQWDDKLFSVRVHINEVGTLSNVGQLLVFFQADALKTALMSEGRDRRGYILILSGEGQVIFDSSDRYYGKLYPYVNKIKSVDSLVFLEEESYISMLPSSSLGYTVFGIMPKREVEAIYEPMKNAVIAASFAFILITISIPSFVVINFSRRTNRIIRSMRRVETGDLTIRIVDEKEDEIGQLSQGFNKMLDELSRHIDRVYVAELKQKHTEFAALQARINPHFLYNTLEVIRMRALSHGAADVSEMIYSLAVLFKSFVQQQTVVTMEEELENCRLYLELFRIRYKDRFAYVIGCDPELAERMMIKMSLQPIVENYIVHGLRSEEEDNLIKVNATLENEMVTIVAEDNGAGMSKERLEQIKRSLGKYTVQEPDDSLGLRSVKERLELIYGKDGRFDIESVQGKGTKIIFSFPALRKGEMENVPRISSR
ncbi:sensor histidine kinase [Paenibacillus algorifonticola]|uniref:sensor histidine kinase n=1 Tax=Paenibacillus algorifonticola TaxID=684063 RepID=UPI003D2AACC0